MSMITKLIDVVDGALSDLECADTQCWCFTRAAMRERPPCQCANCDVWRRLKDVLEVVESA